MTGFSLYMADMHAADLELLGRVEVEYVALPGWGTSITDTTSYEGLPENCRKYVEFIEMQLGIPVEWIGIGPGRESMLRRDIRK